MDYTILISAFYYLFHFYKQNNNRYLTIRGKCDVNYARKSSKDFLGLSVIFTGMTKLLFLGYLVCVRKSILSAHLLFIVLLISTYTIHYCRKCNFSLVTYYSLKFTRCSLLAVKSLVIRCKIRSLFVVEVARYSLKNSLVTRCRSCPLQNITRSLENSLVIRCRSSSLQKITRYKICLLLVAEVTRCKKSLATCCRIRSLLVAKFIFHSL